MKTFLDILAILCFLAAAIFVVKGCFLWCSAAGYIALAVVIYLAGALFTEASDSKW